MLFYSSMKNIISITAILNCTQNSHLGPRLTLKFGANRSRSDQPTIARWPLSWTCLDQTFPLTQQIVAVNGVMIWSD